MAFVQFFLKTLRKQVWYNKKHKEYAMNYSRYNLSGMAELYVYRTFITVNGRRIYAKNYGKRAFRIPIKTR